MKVDMSGMEQLAAGFDPRLADGSLEDGRASVPRDVRAEGRPEQTAALERLETLLALVEAGCRPWWPPPWVTGSRGRRR